MSSASPSSTASTVSGTDHYQLQEQYEDEERLNNNSNSNNINNSTNTTTMPPEAEHTTSATADDNTKELKSQMTEASTLSVGLGNGDNDDDDDDGGLASTLKTSNQHPGYHLRWSRLYKSVEMSASDVNGGGLMRNASISASFHAGKKGLPGSSSHTQTKVILNQVSGAAEPGEVLACMGPSGSGKTSLMNVLSGRASYQEGTISINGEVLNGQGMKRLMSRVAYVKQADVFFDHLTVRDQLTYTALLRLPGDITTAEKHKEVDRIIRMLRLSKVANSPIRMLSGGEKKRVNIGTELLTDPLVILLDEPTSGLDSTSAVSLLKLLQNLAKNSKKTILTSIHQPSSAMFLNGFDKLFMLSEGHVVYFGKPADSLSYLEKVGLACPPGYNAADHWMDLLVTDSAVEEERMQAIEAEKGEAEDADAPPAGELRRRRGGDQAKRKASSRFHLQAVWDNDAVAEEMDRALIENGDRATSSSKVSDNNNGASTEDDAKQSKYPTTWMTQYLILVHRALKNSRSAIFTPLNLIKSLAIGVVAGVLWFQRTYTEANVSDIQSYYFFTMTFWVFDSMFQALMAFPQERVVCLKERASGSYRLSAYFMAKTTSDAPVRIILPLLYMVVSYWMAGIDNRFSVFIGTIGCTLLSVVAGEAIGLFVGAAIYDMEKAITVMTVFTLALMLLGGFFVQNVPYWIEWGKYISPFKYAFDSSLQLVFDRPVPCDGSGALGPLCGGSDTGSAPASEVLQYIGVQGSIGFNVGMLLAICFIPRYFAYLCLRYKREGER